MRGRGRPPKATRAVAGDTYTVELDNAHGRLCVDVDPVNLAVQQIRPGPVQQHNEAQPKLAVHPGDRFIFVNGISVMNLSQIVQALCRSTTVQATLVRAAAVKAPLKSAREKQAASTLAKATKQKQAKTLKASAGKESAKLQLRWPASPQTKAQTNAAAAEGCSGSQRRPPPQMPKLSSAPKGQPSAAKISPMWRKLYGVAEEGAESHRGDRWGDSWRTGIAGIKHRTEEMRRRHAILVEKKQHPSKRGRKSVVSLPAKKAARTSSSTRRVMTVGPATEEDGSVRASTKEFRDSVEKSEQLARASVRARDFTLKAILRSFRALSMPTNTTRKNVMPDGVDTIQAMVLGMYSYGGSIGVSAGTIRHPWLTRLLVGALRKVAPDFPFTSIQLNYNYSTRPHVDKNNLGTSYIVGCGDYSGGEVWVHDEKGDTPYIVEGTEDVSGIYRAGMEFPGTELDVKDTWSIFDGNKLHFTRPFQGERYTMVFFTSDRYASAPANVRKELQEAGFDFDWEAEDLRAGVLEKHEGRAQLQRESMRQRAEENRQLLLLRGRCIGRIWADGWGLRCTAICQENSDLCGAHIERNRWKTHGRMDGPVPTKAKRDEMARTQRRHLSRGIMPPVVEGATILVPLPEGFAAEGTVQP